MGLFGDIFGGLGGSIAGLFGDDKSGEAQDFYKQLAAKYGKLNPNITIDPEDPTTRGAQMDVLRELQNQYRSGGLDAIGKGQIAEAETEANRNAAANENAIEGRARAAGAGGSGVTAALQQGAGQAAAERGAQATKDAAAQAQRSRAAALSGAAGEAGAVRGADRYNAMLKAGAQEQTFGNQIEQLGGEGNAYGRAYGAARNEDERNRRNWAGFGSAVGGAGDTAMGIYQAGGLGNYLNQYGSR